MSGLSRELNRWLQGFNLTYTVRNPKWDFSNGYLVAEILSWFYPNDVLLCVFKTGNSLDHKRLNWTYLRGLFRRKHINVPEEIIYGTMHCKDGAAILLMRFLFELLTSRKARVMPPNHDFDLTDHAYQVQLPMHARATATMSVKNNITLSEILDATSPDMIKKSAEMILRRHVEDARCRRHEAPDRFGKRPTLGEKAIRRPPRVRNLACKSTDEQALASEVLGPFHATESCSRNMEANPHKAIVSNVEDVENSPDVCGEQKMGPVIPWKIESANPNQSRQVLDAYHLQDRSRICDEVKDCRGVFIDDNRPVAIATPFRGPERPRNKLPSRTKDARRQQPITVAKEVRVFQAPYSKHLECMSGWCGY